LKPKRKKITNNQSVESKDDVSKEESMPTEAVTTESKIATNTKKDTGISPRN
jgi:hypothetical protein